MAEYVVKRQACACCRQGNCSELLFAECFILCLNYNSPPFDNMYFSQTCVAINPRISHDCMISQHIMDFFFFDGSASFNPHYQTREQATKPTNQTKPL